LATLRFADEFAVDLERITAHLAAHDASDVQARIEAIVEALQVLVRNPCIGRKATRSRRELIIGRGTRGYVARYRYDEVDDEVLVMGLRAQRESGFAD
jgi:toxin ParE1/3/4